MRAGYVWVCVVFVGIMRLLCGIVHGAGNAMLIRGDTCVAELRLLRLGVGCGCAGTCLFS